MRVMIFNTHLKEIRWKYVGWASLAQDRDKERALVYMIINLKRFHNMRGIFEWLRNC
jgi:hypothetical protein